MYASGSTTRKRVYVRDANDDVAHRAKRSCDDLPQFRPATPESIPPILHESWYYNTLMIVSFLITSLHSLIQTAKIAAQCQEKSRLRAISQIGG